MPAILDLKPEDLDSSDKCSMYTIGILGCGQRGILYANSFADAGFNVLCTDADASVVKKVAKGKVAFSQPEAEMKLKKLITKGQITVSGELKRTVSKSDVVIIAFTAEFNEQKKSNIFQIANSCKHVGAALKQGVLVVYAGIAGLGLINGVIKETLENSSGLTMGQDFGLAYNPVINTKVPLDSQELRVASNDIKSLNAASNVFRNVAKNVKTINDFRIAEVATLISIAKQDANAALANELSVFCESAKVDYFECLKMLDPKDPSFWPNIEETENDEAYLLIENAEILNVKLRLPVLARQTNDSMVKYAVNFTQDSLRDFGKTLRRSRVAVLGSAKPEATPSVFVRMLEKKGAKVNLFDSSTKKGTVNPGLLKSSLNEAVEGSDCIVILSAQVQLSQNTLRRIKPLVKNPGLIVDFTGKIDSSQVETEGFLYRGLGRGNEVT